MGAPIGNQNAAKSRVFEQTMKRACVQEDWKRVRQGVEKLLTLASEGERWALEMVRDTLDGKPVQQADVTVEHSGTVKHLAVQEVDSLVADLLGRATGGDSTQALPH